MRRQSVFDSQRQHIFDRTSAAAERLEAYCQAHLGSPTAVRRPQLLLRGQLWIALLRPSMEDGIVGIGATIEAALRAFDQQYLSRPARRDA
jgi:hypothetical protein